jgi:hypothetical protein
MFGSKFLDQFSLLNDYDIPKFILNESLYNLLYFAFQIKSDKSDPKQHNTARIIFFQEAVKYFRQVFEDESKCNQPKPNNNKTRGGRNIWQMEDELAVGDLIDSMDKEKCWFESIVQEILPNKSIKVHFMGWGSKWDDIILASDLLTRISPLNSKTKNWRSELYEGCLIEIKCNDDLVNQKWMWGKVTTLNIEEAW